MCIFVSARLQATAAPPRFETEWLVKVRASL
jgi:hypothetical protein